MLVRNMWSFARSVPTFSQVFFGSSRFSELLRQNAALSAVAGSELVSGLRPSGLLIPIIVAEPTSPSQQGNRIVSYDQPWHS